MRPIIVTTAIVGFLVMCALLPTGSTETQSAIGTNIEYTQRLPLHLMSWEALSDDFWGGRIDIDDFRYTYIRIVAWLTGEDQYYQ